jgi:hypothetical protein
MYAGYFPAGLTPERIFGDRPSVPFRDNVWPKFPRENAMRVFKHEGFPNVVLEALACGIGVIATPVLGGLPEILEGVAGCVMADAISAPGARERDSSLGLGSVRRHRSSGARQVPHVRDRGPVLAALRSSL